LLHFNRGKGDYHRLGHGTDDHVRRPRKVSSLHNKKVISIAVGSLHCVVCTDAGKCYALEHYCTRFWKYLLIYSMFHLH